MSQQAQPMDPRYAGPGRTPPPMRKKRNWIGRVIGLLVLLFLLVLVCVPLYAWSKITKVDATPSGERPADTPGMTYLLVGSDSREGLSAEERRRLGTGSTAGQRTDTIMLLHVPDSDGPPVLVSIPRDSYVKIPDEGPNKINAAFAIGGPKLLTRTVEQTTGLRVDAYVEIGFGGFVDVVDSVGGIEMCLPKAMKDKDAHINLPAGCQELNGVNALGYVRARKSDPKGDLGRVERQREMVGAVAKEAASWQTIVNPFRYYKVATSGASALTVDEDTGPIDLFRFARGMQSVAGGEGITLTVPVADSNFSTKNGSAVRWDSDKALALFEAIKNDRTTGLEKFAQANR